MTLDKFKELLKTESVDRKVELLKELDPLKLDFNILLDIYNYFKENAKEIKLGTEHYGIIGTGGDRHKTINASTLAAFVASCVILICKVGTIGITSKWGSLNLIEKVGYKQTDSEYELKEQLTKHGFCYVGPKTLGIKYDNALVEARRKIDPAHDIFKVIAPASYFMEPHAQLTGIFDKRMIPLYLALMGHRNGIIVHNYDGIDELSPTSENLVIELDKGRKKNYIIKPEDIGIKKAKLSDIAEYDDLDAQAKNAIDILKGKEKGAKRDFVCLNAGLLLYMGKKVKSIKEGYEKAIELLESGRVYENFRKLMKNQ